MKSPAKQEVNTARDVLYCGAYGTEKDIDYLESSMTFVDKSLPFFTDYYFNKYNLTTNDLIPLAPDASVTLNFTLTKAGKLKFISSDMPFNQVVKSKIIRWFEEMPTMAGFTDKNTKIKEDLDIYCILSPNDALAEKLRANTANMAIVDKVAAEQDAKEKAIEAKQIAEDKKQRELDEKAMEEYYKTLSNFERTINKIDKIAFESKNMGWINCDRFYSDPRPKINLEFTNLNSDFNDYNLQLIYTSINSILTLKNPVANNVPVNETIKIIFIGHKKDEIYFFSKKITTSINKKEVVLEPKKINPSDFDKLYHSALI